MLCGATVSVFSINGGSRNIFFMDTGVGGLQDGVCVFKSTAQLTGGTVILHTFFN